VLGRAAGGFAAAAGEVVAGPPRGVPRALQPAEVGRVLGGAGVGRPDRAEAAAAPAGRGVGRVLTVGRLTAAGRHDRGPRGAPAQARALGARQGRAGRAVPPRAPRRRVGKEARGVAARLASMPAGQRRRPDGARVVPHLETGLRALQSLHHLSDSRRVLVRGLARG
jgi:hypothetical protein